MMTPLPCILCERDMTRTGTRLADGALRCACGVVVEFDYDGRPCSWYRCEDDRPVYGWQRWQVLSVVMCWPVLLLAGWGLLWALAGGRWAWAVVCGVVMFVSACVASEGVPDGTTMRDTIGYLEGLHRHAYADQGWSDARMEAEFRRGLRSTNPRRVIGGRAAIARRLGETRRATSPARAGRRAEALGPGEG